MKTDMLKHRIFSVNDRLYTWKDVLSSSALTPILPSLVHQISESLASLDYAKSHGMNLPVGQLQKASDELRYHLKLITAEETEQWLDTYSLSFEDLSDYLKRKLWRKWKEDSGIHLLREFTNHPLEKIIPLLWPETVLEGQFPVMATAFAKRALSCMDSSEKKGPDRKWIDDVLNDFCNTNQISAENISAFVQDHILLKDSFELFLNMEATYRQKQSEIVTPESCERELERQKANLVRFNLAIATFDRLDAAREPCLCIQQDHEGLDEIANYIGATYAQQSFFLSEAPIHLKARLFSTMPDEVIGPVSEQNQFIVIHVIKKEAPTLNNPEILSRIRKCLLKNYFTPLMARIIDWNRFEF